MALRRSVLAGPINDGYLAAPRASGASAVASSFIRLESRTRGHPRTAAQLIRAGGEDLKRRRGMEG